MSQPIPRATFLQGALWGPAEVLDSSVKPLFDKAAVSFGHVSNHDGPRLIGDFEINGEPREIDKYPSFVGLKNSSFLGGEEFPKTPTRAVRCPYCGTKLSASSSGRYDDIDGDEDGQRCAYELVEFCTRCRFWQLQEDRLSFFGERATTFSRHDATIFASKIREFDTVAPDGALDEISQWFRRDPLKYHNVTPLYLEKLVKKIFEESGTYVEVHHVGRPGDGGVDVVLVDSENKTWLVQVKRRESPTAVERVDTIRNLLGTLVLGNSRTGVVVSTADHFTRNARVSAKMAADVGYTIELVDKKALDRLLGQTLRSGGWSPLQREVGQERTTWLAERWSGWELPKMTLPLYEG